MAEGGVDPRGRLAGLDPELVHAHHREPEERSHFVSLVVNTFLLVGLAVFAGLEARGGGTWPWLVLVIMAVATGILTFRGPGRRWSGIVVPTVTVLGVVAWYAFTVSASSGAQGATVLVALAYGGLVFWGARWLRDPGWLVVPALFGVLMSAGSLARCAAVSAPGVACDWQTFLDPVRHPVMAGVFVLLVVLAVVFGGDHWTPDRPGMRKVRIVRQD